MKVVINTCFGGFGLSEKAWKRYSELAGFKLIKYPGKFGDELYKDSVQEDNFLFHSEMLWPHQVAERLRQLKDKP